LEFCSRLFYQLAKGKRYVSVNKNIKEEKAMYKVISSYVRIEGEDRLTFGLSYNDDVFVPDISTSKQNVDKLAELFNKEEVDVKTAEILIEDFLADGI
jgi:hypothetical protein